MLLSAHIRRFSGLPYEEVLTEHHTIECIYALYDVSSVLCLFINLVFILLYVHLTVLAQGEYDCDDATCIKKSLVCNGVKNCKFGWDEDSCMVSNLNMYQPISTQISN